MNKRILNNQVDLILFEQGSFIPVNWLLKEGGLDYQDYLNWKQAGSGLLTDLLLRPMTEVIADLQSIRHYAADLKLEAFELDYSGADDRVSFCQNPKDEHWFTTGYQPAQDRVQMDLFFDSAPVCASSDVAKAIVANNISALPELLDKLQVLDPNKYQQFEQMLGWRDQLRSLTNNANDKIKMLTGQIIPQALVLFGRDSQDFITPLWQTLTEQLQQQPFDPANPDGHASFTAGKAYQWQQVIEAVRGQADWLQQPLLIFRIAEANFKLNYDYQGFKYWFHLFFRFADTASQMIEQSSYSLLLSDWHRFNELDPELANELFPVWLLITKPMLATMAEQQDFDNEAFQWLAELVTERGGQVSHSTVERRQQLQQKHPDLFEHYMSSLVVD